MKLLGRWKFLGGSVWESAKGTRIHVGGGLIRCQKDIRATNNIAEMMEFFHYENLMGGNRKRALMAMAENRSDLEC